MAYLDLHLVIDAAQVLELSIIAPPSEIASIEHVAPVAWTAF